MSSEWLNLIGSNIGVLAQLGACHTGSVEVTGSSPVYSIILRR